MGWFLFSSLCYRVFFFFFCSCPNCYSRCSCLGATSRLCAPTPTAMGGRFPFQKENKNKDTSPKISALFFFYYFVYIKVTKKKEMSLELTFLSSIHWHEILKKIY